VSHSYQTYFGFPGSDLNLDCGFCDHVITRFASVGIRARIRNKVISLCYFRFFFSVPLGFSVFVSIFLFFVSASSKQKKSVIFYLVTVSNHISILKKKRERERGGLVEIWRIIQFLPQKHNSWWTISKTPYNQLKLHILFIGCDIALYVKFGIILILFAWGFNSRFNSAAETLFLVNHMPIASESIENPYYIYSWWYCNTYKIWSYFDIVCMRFLLYVQFCRKLIIHGVWVPRHNRRTYKLRFVVFLGILILYIKFEVIWIAFSLGSRIGFCLAVRGLFGVVFQNLFCFCWFRSYHFTIIIFWYLVVVWVIFITFTFVCFSISYSPNKSQIRNLESKSVSSCLNSIIVFVFFFFSLFVSYIHQGRGNREVMLINDAKN